MSSGYPITPRLNNPDGTTNIYCRQCGRIIAKRINPLIRTVSQCAICLGAPPERVLAQYVQMDPTKPATPLTQEDPIYFYEEEEEAAKSGLPWTGMFKPLFRALGFGGKKDDTPSEEPINVEQLRSKKIAKSKRSGGLLER